MQEDVDYYRIGTIAKLTGLSVERLRAWERRYELIPALKQGKTRYYSRPQLDRLQKIKRLVDAGHAISSLVDLSDQHLEARLTSRTTGAAPAALRAGLIGPNLLVLEQTQKEPSRLGIQARWSNMAAFSEDDHATTGDLDVIVAQVPVLSPSAVQFIRNKSGKSAIVLLYQYATEAQVESVQAEGIPVLHWPTSWSEIEQTCARIVGKSLLSSEASPPVYTDEELIAIGASDKDANGLPGHLVEMILQLNSFSVFALDCADTTRIGTGAGADGSAAAVGKNAAAGNDAATYEHVHIEATRARAQLELALQTLVNSERQRATPH